MAFYYYTTETIKEIDPEAIPEGFFDYFSGLTDNMKMEIKDIHPELYAHVIDFYNDKDHMVSVSRDEESLDLAEDEQRIIDKWESINIQEWHGDSVFSDVLVCKIIPDGVSRCKIHRKDFVKKQIKYKDGKAIYAHYGFLCPDCMVLYIEESKIGDIIQNLDKRNHEMWIQPLENTLQEWNEYVEPTEINVDETIYLPDSWADVDMRCPADGGELVPDVYKILYRDREVRFEACQCDRCKKILMRNSLAQQLNLDCGRVGVPEVSFERIKRPIESDSKKSRSFKPSYFVQNGEKSVYDYDDKKWEVLPESTTVVMSSSRICNIDDHDTDDQLVLIRVDEKKGGNKKYLVLVGYCIDCNKYFIAQEDFEILYAAGRPCVTIYDATNSDYYIQSGAVFEEEKKYLNEIETSIKDSITEIENREDYVSQYASGDYDDGALAFKKKMSKPLQDQIDELSTHIDKPYGYRVELLEEKTSKIYYLGASDFEIGGKMIHSFNSDWGRKMVNYRNLEVSHDGKKYQVKRRRQFDISRAVLFGYIEQSDEDAIFREGLTDPYLVKVLNTRKRQHQLVDIMFTIQENQNAIIDAPLEKNIIVQGCAGSGKTVVMLQRLSALKYGNTGFDFENVVILTPNDNFNTHISGLASSLQLGYVERMPVERYYEKILLSYSDDFRLKYAISDEMNVNQVFVDFIYSDEFMKIFWKAYDSVIEEIEKSYDATVFVSKNLLDEYSFNTCFSIDKPQITIILSLINELNKRVDKVISNGNVNERSMTYSKAFTKVTEANSALFRFLDGIEGFNIKSIYNEIYEVASKEVDEILFTRTGKRYLGGTRGTHRYDLYIQLMFAQKFYGFNAGHNTLICIDEGQDLCVNEYKLIKSINGDKSIFNIFGDTNQLLKYNRGINAWNIVNECIGESMLFTLNENFRNTNQITQFCNDTFKMNVIKTGVDGHRVLEIIRSKLETTLADLNVSEDRIAIILPRSVKKNSYIDLDQLPEEIRDNIGDQIGNGRVCVSYVDEIKGIEFDKVFVVANGLTNNEKYIAYTRALSELIIVFDEDLEEKIREKEEFERIAQEKEANKILSSDDNRTESEMNVSKNIKFGKVKSNKSKVEEYEDSVIAYTYTCRRCKKKIEMTKKEFEKFNNMGLEMPKTCHECKKQIDEIIDIGKCKYCGKSIMITRGKYEYLKSEGKLSMCCDDCVPKMLEERERYKNSTYLIQYCAECRAQFKITHGEKEFYEKKGWQLPTRCQECRKRKRDQ